MRRTTPERQPRGPQRTRRRHLWLFAVPLLLGLAGCTEPLPQNSLSPAGPVAERQADLYFFVFWIAVGVFVVVEGLLVYALIRFRRRSERDTPVQVHGNTRLEVAWTIVPAILLAWVAVPTIRDIFALSRPPDRPPVAIDVVGHKWWWEVRYPQQDGIDEEFVTANEIHIPVGQPVVFRLTSEELSEDPNVGLPLIHSFWVPRLAGKQDVVPGRTNLLRLEASEPGIYPGQCAEYCGLSHYLMRFRVVAQPQDEFRRWVEGQQQDAATPPEGSDAAEGLEVFTNPLPQGTGSCVACHTIEGVEAALGTLGPNLTHFGSRGTVAAGILPNDPEGLATWLRNPPAVKPGSKMPDYRLTEEQIDALVAYLQSLE